MLKSITHLIIVSSELKNREDARFRDRQNQRIASAWTRVAEWRSLAWRGQLPSSIFGSSSHGAGLPTPTVSIQRFNIADMSMFCGYAPAALLRAVSDRMARDAIPSARRRRDHCFRRIACQRMRRASGSIPFQANTSHSL
jgi:hypothetical protein